MIGLLVSLIENEEVEVGGVGIVEALAAISASRV